MATESVGEQPLQRKYTVAEIDRMRRALDDLITPINQSFMQAEIDKRVELQLQTHMLNGTDPDDLVKSANDRMTARFDAHLQHQAAMVEYHKQNPEPAPRVLRTAEDVIDEWFQTSVAQYTGACSEAKELFDGFMGKTLKRFANNHAPDGVHIHQKDMERYLDKKGIRSRHAMFAKRYDGIQLVIHGNVRSGNYGT